MNLINKTLTYVFENKNASSAIILFLVFYGSLAAPKLPNFIVKLFENSDLEYWQKGRISIVSGTRKHENVLFCGDLDLKITSNSIY